MEVYSHPNDGADTGGERAPAPVSTGADRADAASPAAGRGVDAATLADLFRDNPDLLAQVLDRIARQEAA